MDFVEAWVSKKDISVRVPVCEWIIIYLFDFMEVVEGVFLNNTQPIFVCSLMLIFEKQLL
jgi:hypothetical protein